MNAAQRTKAEDQIEYVVIKLRQLPPKALKMVVAGAARGIDRYLEAMTKLDSRRTEASQ